MNDFLSPFENVKIMIQFNQFLYLIRNKNRKLTQESISLKVK